MRLKPFIAAARLTPRQYEKLSTAADFNGLTMSSVIGLLVDDLPEGRDLFTPIGGNANGGAEVVEAERAAVAA